MPRSQLPHLGCHPDRRTPRWSHLHHSVLLLVQALSVLQSAMQPAAALVDTRKLEQAIAAAQRVDVSTADIRLAQDKLRVARKQQVSRRFMLLCCVFCKCY